MTEKLEYSAADMASAAAGGWRDGQRAAAEAAQSALAGEREAFEVFAIPVRENGKRTTIYTEVLPFVPGPGVEVLGEPVRMVAAQPAPAVEREEVEVVAVVKHDSPLPGYTDFMKYESWMDDGLSAGWTQLMTVAQHERILAAQQRTQANAERLQQQEEQARRDDAGYNLRELFKRGAAALNLEPDETSWFEIVGELEKLAAAQSAPATAVAGNLREVLAMVLQALERDAAEGRAVRGEMAAELRAAMESQSAPAGEQPAPYGWVAAGQFFAAREDAVDAAEKTPCVEVYSRPQVLAILDRSAERQALAEELARQLRQTCDELRALKSAPAGEREAVEQQIVGRYTVHPTGRGFWPYCVRAGDGERELFVGHKRKCEEVAAELQSACLDGAFMQSVWRRTQAAAVPDIPQQWSKSLAHCWPEDCEDRDGDWCIGTIDEDGNFYEVVKVEASQYDAAGESQKIAESIVALWAYAAAPAQPAVHPDDAAVDRFAAAMKAKLAKAREKGRGGWDDPAQCSVEFLAKLLVEHLTKGNAGTFEDVANFAMMLHQRGADPQVLAREAAAQSAPAGEREAYNAWHLETYKTTAIGGSDYRAFQAGAAWQRTQAAGVPEGWRSSLEDAALMLEAHSPGSGSVESYAAQDIRALLDAAPAQPAARDRVRASLSPENQRIVPVEPLLADPHPLAAAQGEVQRLRAERDAFLESRNDLIEEVSIYLLEIADLREALERIARCDNWGIQQIALEALAAGTGQEAGK